MCTCVVTAELLEGNIPICDGKIFELVKFQKEQVVGVILYEENPTPGSAASTSASAKPGVFYVQQSFVSCTFIKHSYSFLAPEAELLVCCSQKTTVPESSATGSNVSLSPLVPRRHEVPPRLRPPQSGQCSPRLLPTFGAFSGALSQVQNAAAPHQPLASNASPNELFVKIGRASCRERVLAGV